MQCKLLLSSYVVLVRAVPAAFLHLFHNTASHERACIVDSGHEVWSVKGEILVFCCTVSWYFFYLSAGRIAHTSYPIPIHTTTTTTTMAMAMAMTVMAMAMAMVTATLARGEPKPRIVYRHPYTLYDRNVMIYNVLHRWTALRGQFNCVGAAWWIRIGGQDQDKTTIDNNDQVDCPAQLSSVQFTAKLIYLFYWWMKTKPR